MFTTIDKNLLIAALESALLYAQTSAGVASLEDLTISVAALRSAFDANPANVTDAQIEQMIATLQAVEIPDPAALARLLTMSGITDTGSYLAVCSWATLLNKPATFPPAIHRHNWSEVDYKPYKYEPKDHAHAYADITAKPATFPPSEHTHPAQPAASVAWNDITEKPTTFAPGAHTHPDTEVLFDDARTFPPGPHVHDSFGDLQGVAQHIRADVMGTHFPVGIVLYPTSVPVGGTLWADCDGSAISRDTPGGDALAYYGCQFGTGDGTTTVNLPNMTAPTGFVYRLFVGEWGY